MQSVNYEINGDFQNKAWYSINENAIAWVVDKVDFSTHALELTQIMAAVREEIRDSHERA